MRLSERSIVNHSSFTLQIYIGTITLVDYLEIPIDTSTCDQDEDEDGDGRM